jgi:segregation and condensation protein B
MTDDARIEAILFYRGEPVTRAEIARDTGLSPSKVGEGLEALAARLAVSGLTLIETGDTVELRTAQGASELIEKMKREALNKDLGKAGAETLALVLYRGPLSRSEIDYIRGVNSTFVLRNLLMRGLVVRNPNPKDQRSYIYEATSDLLSLLGVSRVSDLPEYESVRADIAAIEKTEVPDEEVPADIHDAPVTEESHG